MRYFSFDGYLKYELFFVSGDSTTVVTVYKMESDSSDDSVIRSYFKKKAIKRKY